MVTYGQPLQPLLVSPCPGVDIESRPQENLWPERVEAHTRLDSNTSKVRNPQNYLVASSDHQIAMLSSDLPSPVAPLTANNVDQAPPFVGETSLIIPKHSCNSILKDEKLTMQIMASSSNVSTSCTEEIIDNSGVLSTTKIVAPSELRDKTLEGKEEVKEVSFNHEWHYESERFAGSVNEESLHLVFGMESEKNESKQPASESDGEAMESESEIYPLNETEEEGDGSRAMLGTEQDDMAGAADEDEGSLASDIEMESEEVENEPLNEKVHQPHAAPPWETEEGDSEEEIYQNLPSIPATDEEEVAWIKNVREIYRNSNPMNNLSLIMLQKTADEKTSAIEQKVPLSKTEKDFYSKSKISSSESESLIEESAEPIKEMLLTSKSLPQGARSESYDRKKETSDESLVRNEAVSGKFSDIKEACHEPLNKKESSDESNCMERETNDEPLHVTAISDESIDKEGETNDESLNIREETNHKCLNVKGESTESIGNSKEIGDESFSKKEETSDESLDKRKEDGDEFLNNEGTGDDSVNKKEETGNESLDRKEETGHESFNKKEEIGDESLCIKEQTSDEFLDKKEETGDESLNKKEETGDESLNKKEETCDELLKNKKEASDKFLNRKEETGDEFLNRKEELGKESFNKIGATSGECQDKGEETGDEFLNNKEESGNESLHKKQLIDKKNFDKEETRDKKEETKDFFYDEEGNRVESLYKEEETSGESFFNKLETKDKPCGKNEETSGYSLRKKQEYSDKFPDDKEETRGESLDKNYNDESPNMTEESDESLDMKYQDKEEQTCEEEDEDRHRSHTPSSPQLTFDRKIYQHLSSEESEDSSNEDYRDFEERATLLSSVLEGPSTSRVFDYPLNFEGFEGDKAKDANARLIMLLKAKSKHPHQKPQSSKSKTAPMKRGRSTLTGDIQSKTEKISKHSLVKRRKSSQRVIPTTISTLSDIYNERNELESVSQGYMKRRGGKKETGLIRHKQGKSRSNKRKSRHSALREKRHRPLKSTEKVIEKRNTRSSDKRLEDEIAKIMTSRDPYERYAHSPDITVFSEAKPRQPKDRTEEKAEENILQEKPPAKRVRKRKPSEIDNLLQWAVESGPTGSTSRGTRERQYSFANNSTTSSNTNSNNNNRSLSTKRRKLETKSAKREQKKRGRKKKARIDTEDEEEERKHSQGNNSSDDQMINSEEELSDVGKSKGRTSYPYKGGDLVWVHLEGRWWPGYVDQPYPQSRRVSVYRVGIKQEASIKVELDKVHSFVYGEVPEFVDRSESGFTEAFQVTESFCLLRNHGNKISAHKFFTMPPEEQDAVIIVSFTPKDDPVLTAPQEKRTRGSTRERACSKNRKRYYDDSFNSDSEDGVDNRREEWYETPVRDHRRLQKSLRSRRRENEKLMNFMNSPECMDHLWQIFTGEKQCERHKLYQSEATRRSLLWSGIGPFLLDQDDDQILSVVDFLHTEINRKQPDFNLAQDYVFKVWMPEAIKEALRVVLKVPEDMLELALDEGYRESLYDRNSRRLDFL